MIIQRLLRLSKVRILPKVDVQMKKLTLEGTLGFHRLLQGKEKWNVEC